MFDSVLLGVVFVAIQDNTVGVNEISPEVRKARKFDYILFRLLPYKTKGQQRNRQKAALSRSRRKVTTELPSMLSIRLVNILFSK